MGAIETLYVSPPDGSVVVCLDEMGPEAAKSWPGERLVVAASQPEPALRPAGRARQEIDSGRRENGYVFGAFRLATGDAFTAPYRGRTTANWVDFLEKSNRWTPGSRRRSSASLPFSITCLDNLSAHRASNVLLSALAHPRWEFVFQPKYAAYLNLIEPWWKALRSLALKGRRFANWKDVTLAVQRAATYWNAHQLPCFWSRGRRHHPRRAPGIACLPPVV